MEPEGIVTFDYIYECWKTKDYPEGFDDILEKYLENKRIVFANTNVIDITSWLSKILVSIEIGLSRDSARFEKQRIFWLGHLGRDWVVSVEDKWVSWKEDNVDGTD